MIRLNAFMATTVGTAIAELLVMGVKFAGSEGDTLHLQQDGSTFCADSGVMLPCLLQSSEIFGCDADQPPYLWLFADKADC